MATRKPLVSVGGRLKELPAGDDIAASDAGAEPAITAGTASQYWRGDKTWQNFGLAARSALLTGLSTASASIVAATDSVLSAIGKLQAQITALVVDSIADADTTHAPSRNAVFDALALKQDAIADSGWTNATLQNSWVAFGGTYAAPSYRKVGSIVYLRGVMKSGTGTTGTVVFTLPTGFRPSAAGSYSTPAPDSPTVDARIDVNTSGTVVISATMTSTTYLAIDGIQFFID